MSRKAAPAEDICAAPKGWPELPFVMRDVTSVINNDILVLGRSFGAWLGVVHSIAYGGVCTMVMPDYTCSLASVRGKRFFPASTSGAVSNLRDMLRSIAVRDDATPEAVRLLHAHTAFTNEEVRIMSEKLAKKGAAKAAPKAEKAEKGDAPKKKGNTEALKKAREAAAERGPDVRKITVVNKDGPGYREGSNRAASWAALKGAKTVEDYKSNGGAVKYIARWESEGHIKLS